MRVDVVGKCKDRVLKPRVPLQGNLNVPRSLLALEVEDSFVHRVLRLVDVLHEVPDPPVVLVSYGAVLLALVYERDLEPLVQKRRLTESPRQRIEGELLRLRKDLWVGQKADGGPGSLALLELARLLDLALWEPTLVALGKEVAISPYLHLEPLGEGVDHGRPNTMQAAGALVALSVELPAGMQGGHDDLGRRLAVLVHLADRHTTPIIGHRDCVVWMHGHGDLRAVASQGLVYRVVNDLPYEMVQSPRSSRTDIHTWSTLDSLQPLQNLDGACIVIALAILGNRVSRQRTRPSLLKCPAPPPEPNSSR